MQSVFRAASQLQAWRRSVPSTERVAMVPTMGYLHEGHMSLLEEARRRVPAGKGHVVLTIFVNPTQFGPSEDFESYPRDEARDFLLAKKAGVDVVFCPRDPAEVYPSNQTWVEVERLSEHLCGSARPGHFRGVCTVVAKLWGLVRPDFAVFGEKDFQQLAIVRRMHADLFLSGEVVGVPTVREADGLAMSSRNVRLDAQRRIEAQALPRFLDRVVQRFESKPHELSVESLIGDAEHALAPGVLDYCVVCAPDDLSPLPQTAIVPSEAVVAVAAWFGSVRLIDHAYVRAKPRLT